MGLCIVGPCGGGRPSPKMMATTERRCPRTKPQLPVTQDNIDAGVPSEGFIAHMALLLPLVALMVFVLPSEHGFERYATVNAQRVQHLSIQL
jgi:hypothetical protein